MTPIAAMFLIAKVTLLFTGGLAALRTTRPVSPAVRHLMCLLPLAASILLPLTLIPTHPAIPIRIEALASSTAPAARVATAADPMTLLALIWLAGAIFILLRLALGHWRLDRIVRLAHRAGVHDGIPVLSGDVSVPLVAGVWRPSILMPITAATWDTAHYEAALQHETAHVRRGDLAANLISRIACALWWFHPLVWMLAARQRTEQEAACDDAAIAAGCSPASYAGALFAAGTLPLQLSTSGSPMFTKNDFTNRIQRLANYQSPRPLSRPMLFRLGLSFAITLGLLVTLGPAAGQSAPYRVGGDVLAPHLVYRVDPAYPADAKDEKVEGTVTLNVVILASGIAGDITVEKSADARLDEAAIEAVRQWKFDPGTLKGVPVSVQAVIEVNFHLK